MKILCIDNSRQSPFLTVGKIYDVLKYDEQMDSYQILSDTGEVYYFYAYRFVEVEVEAQNESEQ